MTNYKHNIDTAIQYTTIDVGQWLPEKSGSDHNVIVHVMIKITLLKHTFVLFKQVVYTIIKMCIFNSI